MLHEPTAPVNRHSGIVFIPDLLPATVLPIYSGLRPGLQCSGLCILVNLINLQHLEKNPTSLTCKLNTQKKTGQSHNGIEPRTFLLCDSATHLSTKRLIHSAS